MKGRKERRRRSSQTRLLLSSQGSCLPTPGPSSPFLADDIATSIHRPSALTCLTHPSSTAIHPSHPDLPTLTSLVPSIFPVHFSTCSLSLSPSVKPPTPFNRNAVKRAHPVMRT